MVLRMPARRGFVELVETVLGSNEHCRATTPTDSSESLSLSLGHGASVLSSLLSYRVATRIELERLSGMEF
jgi:hypothetical protein